MKSYEPSRHLISFHVAGFQHWDGATVLSKLSPDVSWTLSPSSTTPTTQRPSLYI